MIARALFVVFGVALVGVVARGEGTPGDGLRRAVEAMRAGDARAAWMAAESEPDADQRSQAKVYVRLQAGDLEGALGEAERGSAEHPDDAWLAERCVSVALTLNRVGAADLAIARLESAATRSPESDRARWLEALRAAQVDVEALHRGTRERDDADRRARWVTVGISSLCVGALLFLARRA